MIGRCLLRTVRSGISREQATFPLRRDCYLLTLTANLLEDFGGGGITGSDVVRIQLNQEGSP
jgi:hypothetical protein